MSIEQQIDALAAFADADFSSELAAAYYKRCWRAERKLREAAKRSYSYEMVERLHAEAEAILRGES